MKFLCDVHISYRLCKFLKNKDCECTHINEILDKWHTKDKDISDFADKFDCIIITKDLDFRNSFILQNKPKKLIRVILGNISNSEMLILFEKHWQQIELISKRKTFFIEIGKTLVVYPEIN